MYLTYRIIFGITILAIFSQSHWAQAAVYMQQDLDDEIRLTNLQVENETGVNMPHNMDNDNEQYVLLVADEIAATKQPASNANLHPDSSKDSNFSEAIFNAARQTALQPALLHAVIRVESNYNPKAVSARGARGLMQLMPETAKRFNVTNSYDPAQNVLGGAQYLKELHTLFKGDLKLVLAAYNAGPNAVLKYGSKIPPYAETKQYVPKVLDIYRKLASSSTF